MACLQGVSEERGQEITSQIEAGSHSGTAKKGDDILTHMYPSPLYANISRPQKATLHMLAELKMVCCAYV
jgi:hypothetical protein